MSTNLKFITGFSGEAHIKPSMDAQWHSAITGMETCVWDYGQNFAASINQANSTIRIADGVGQIQGRLFLIEESLIETVSYPNVPPEVGLTRIDTIILHWGTSSRIINGETVTVNTCEFEYKKNPLANGEAETFEVTDLNLGDTDAYFPMWHVLWNENGIQSITPIFEIVAGGCVVTIDIPSFSSLPVTITDSKIRERHKVVNSILSNPSAQTGDWTVTTSNGSLTISGSISGSTSISIDLAPAQINASEQ